VAEEETAARPDAVAEHRDQATTGSRFVSSQRAGVGR